jgi:hypothetical protein
MIRRLLRAALWLGVLAGVAAAIAKVVQSRRAAPGYVGGGNGSGPLEARPAWMPPEPATRETAAPAAEPEPAVATPAADAVAADDHEAPAGERSWVEPVGGLCPTTHPVKAKLSSKIFHVPGGTMYDRTVADRCYGSAAAAEADGLRAAKR